jgi:hypothetical protein
MKERTLRPGSVRCRCGRCGRHFGGLRAFDAHQRLDDKGCVLCLHPADVGLVVKTDKMGAWWSQPAPTLGTGRRADRED